MQRLICSYLNACSIFTFFIDDKTASRDLTLTLLL